MHSAFKHLQDAYTQNPCPTLKERRVWLKRLEKCLLAEQDRLTQAIAQDFVYRAPQHTLLVDILPSLLAIRHAYRKVSKWMQSRRVSLSPLFWPARAMITPQPLGVVGIVVPWNYPVYLSIGPLVNALSAGNRVMIKISEYTPTYGHLLSELLADFLGDDVVCVVNGGPEVAKAFVNLPFDHLLYTGSTHVGRQVMATAAKNLTPVTLELGGKCPVLVAKDTDMDTAAKRILNAKIANAGQTCVAPDYVLVEAACADAFMAAFRRVAGRYMKSSRPQMPAGIIHKGHQQRLQELLDGVKSGAQIEWLVPTVNEDGLGLAVVYDPPARSALMQEEIFGPILPIIPVKDFSDGIAYVRSRPHPLAVYVFTQDKQKLRAVHRQILCGGLVINDCALHVVQDALPFGGVRESGIGHYHGQFGFETFSKLKPVFIQSRWAATDWLLGKTTPLKTFLTRLLIRWGR